MPQDPKKLCRRYGLAYIETTDLRLRRRRCGNGFAYIDSDGRIIRNKTLTARIKQLEASLFRGRLRSGLNRIESALMRFLERRPARPG